MVKYIFLSILIILTFSACSIKNSEYPKNWAEIKSSSGLINGKFECMGESPDRTNNQRALNFEFGESISETCDIVEIIQRNRKVLQVSFIYNNKIIKTKEYRFNENFTYEDDGILIKSSSECDTGNGILVCHNNKSFLKVSEKEDLVVKRTEIGAATILFVIPIFAGGGSDWALYKKIQ